MKVWSTEYADSIFSKSVRARDPICIRCYERQSSDCSHHFERGNSATRYHPKNGDSVCRFCHQYWHAHRDEYVKFKKKQLGARAYLDLQRLAASVMKRETAIINFMKSYERN